MPTIKASNFPLNVERIILNELSAEKAGIPER